MTRSSAFAAAVSGAGIFDMTGYYFSTEHNYKETQAWRFKSQQWRMKSSFYDAKESYYENSPIFHAEKITAPLLIWCGKEDSTVPTSQNVALYHALHRMKKETVLLQYKKENHTLEDPGNQKDLNLKIKEWFDHYLKGATPKEWLEENL
jgi:dipeptidyl aminopeptidase/acylaminoacyl peptidase